MNNAQTLTRHRDIQNWVVGRHGMPAIARIPDPRGEMRSHLTLRFAGTRRLRGMPDSNEGISPVSWSAWLAELDRQNLALRVPEDGEADFELVARKDLN